MYRLSLGLLAVTCLAGTPASAPASSPFQTTIQPFFQKNCVMCHSEKGMAGGLSLQGFHSGADALHRREAMEHVVRRLKTGEMPPKGMPRPPQSEIEAVVQWIESSYDEIDRNRKPDPGRLTAHRLNRSEYNYTVDDLFGIDFQPANDFPADDAGYGFDNIGDVLSISPVLMEKYLSAAAKVARTAVQAANDPLPGATREKVSFPRHRIQHDAAAPVGFAHRFRIANEADYEIRIGMGGQRVPLKTTLVIDGAVIGSQDVEYKDEEKPRTNDFKVHLTAGEHWIAGLAEREAITMAPGTPPRLPLSKQAEAEFLKALMKKKPDPGPPQSYVDHLELRGPYNPKPAPLSEAHKRIFVCGEQTPECARKIVARLAPLAWRRPVTEAEIHKLAGFVALAQQQGDTFPEGVRLAIQAMLVSPEFLFRVERDAEPANADRTHRVGDYELAARLSYFLWSSLPDAELFRLAAANRLHEPQVLAEQVRRLMRDPRSARFVENFAGQWLQLRNLDSLKPDPDKFPEFDPDLRAAMKTETRMFFEAVMREDRSILDFLDGNYTFLNERLAKFYGIDGVRGDNFRRVELHTNQRSGVLTQAAILTVSSYPTRTSPVIRGKWVLENLLNDPPPPPPPGVPNLDEKAAGNSMSLRQTLEKHRANPVCASCHNRMDPLGFGLENYDAIGRWRTADGKFPLDTSGTLPNGKSFKTPAELKTTLRADAGRFTDCVTEKMLTYALGRGLEHYDTPTVKSISKQVAASDYRFSTLVLEIVKSLPFQMRRGEGERHDDGQVTTKAQLP